ncbi:MAG: hypothetical protein ACI4RD_00210 [Kiritimatiellia bacterium]
MNGADVAFSSAIPVALTVAALVVVFPDEALRRIAPPTVAANRPSAAFVTLDERAEIAVLRRVKDEWRKGGGERRVDADLLFFELPGTEKSAILPIESRSRPPAPALAEEAITPFLPSLRASAPVRTPTAPETSDAAFPREEMLKLD